MTPDIASEVRAAMIARPTMKLRVEPSLGGYRIISHDGRVLVRGSDLAFARQLVDEHNKDVEKNLLAGGKHL